MGDPMSSPVSWIFGTLLAVALPVVLTARIVQRSHDARRKANDAHGDGAYELAPGDTDDRPDLPPNVIRPRSLF